jgi:multidrug efflux system membrane fusion protein
MSVSHRGFDQGRRTTRSRGRLTAIVGGVAFCLVAGGLLWFWVHTRSPVETANSQPRAEVPVSIATAVPQDVPIYLTGLGTVQAIATVGIHSQIDGKLQDVLFTEGQRVKKGDLLAKIDPRLFQAALDQAKAKKAQDEATQVGLEKDLVRFKTLGAKGFDTQQNIDQQQAKVDTGKAAIAADEAAIQTAQTQLDYTNITAPTDGRMGLRMVDAGNVIHASDPGPIAILVQTQPATVVFTLPADTLDDVRKAQAQGSVQVLAFDRDNQNELSTGTLATIDNQIDQTTATYRLKASFANEDERLWQGQFVNARLLLQIRNHALVIPTAAVQHGPQGLFTWVVTEKNTAVARPIEVGPAAGNLTIVSSGLSESERVVTAGQYKLTADSPVIENKDQPSEAKSAS